MYSITVYTFFFQLVNQSSRSVPLVDALAFSIELDWRQASNVHPWLFQLHLIHVQGRSENSHYFGLFNIILSQISPEIISIIRDASQLSGIMTKPSRIRFFFEKWLFLVKLHPIKKISCYLLIWPEVRKWSIFELHCDRLPHIESSNGIDVY